MPPKSPFTNQVRRLRFEKGEMTQGELATLVGATRQTINALESNKSVPSLLWAGRIARVFGEMVEDVFELEGTLG